MKRMKEIRKVKAEINKIENRKKWENSMKQKFSFETKNGQTVSNSNKVKREETLIIRNKTGIHTVNIKRMRGNTMNN